MVQTPATQCLTRVLFAVKAVEVVEGGAVRRLASSVASLNRPHEQGRAAAGHTKDPAVIGACFPCVLGVQFLPVWWCWDILWCVVCVCLSACLCVCVYLGVCVYVLCVYVRLHVYACLFMCMGVCIRMLVRALMM
jgi:hypothetical protein